MTPRLSAMSFTFALAALPAYGMQPPPVGVTTDNAKVVKVVDGDTLDIVVTYKIRVRLIDCWAPEKRAEDGERAWEDLEHYIGGKDVVVHIPSERATSMSDVFTLSRVLGYVWPKGVPESLNEWQVKRGNATRAKAK